MKVTCQCNICIEAKKNSPSGSSGEVCVCLSLCAFSLPLSLSLSPPPLFISVCVLLATVFSWYSKEFILQHGLLNTHRNVLKTIFPAILHFQTQQHVSHTQKRTYIQHSRLKIKRRKAKICPEFLKHFGIDKMWKLSY